MLETALSLHGANHPLKCAEIEGFVGRISVGAQARGIQAERLIIDLKQVWYSVPASASHQKADVISRLVTMCILEFYRTHPETTAKS